MRAPRLIAGITVASAAIAATVVASRWHRDTIDIPVSRAAACLTPLAAAATVAELIRTSLAHATACYPPQVALSLRKHPRCAGKLDANAALMGYVNSYAEQKWGDAVRHLAEFESQLQCYGERAVRTFDYGLGIAIRQSDALSPLAGEHALSAYWNPALIVIDHLQHTGQVAVLSAYRERSKVQRGVLNRVPHRELGLWLPNPLRGEFTRVPGPLCKSSKACMSASHGYLSVIEDPRRLGVGACPLLSLPDRGFYCLSNVVCPVAGLTAHLEVTTPLLPGPLGLPERTRRFGLDDGDAQQYLCALGNLPAPGPLPWVDPQADMFDCLLAQRRDYENSVACYANVDLYGAQPAFLEISGEGSSGVLDPECGSHPMADEECNTTNCDFSDEPIVIESDAGTRAEAALRWAKEKMEFEPVEAENLNSVCPDGCTTATVQGAIDFAATRPVELLEAPEFLDRMPVPIDAGNTAFYDKQSQTIYLNKGKLAERSTQDWAMTIHHEMLHAALFFMGVEAGPHGGSTHHDLMGGFEPVFVRHLEPTFVFPVKPKGANDTLEPSIETCSARARALTTAMSCIDKLARHARGENANMRAIREPRFDPRKARPVDEGESDDMMCSAVQGASAPAFDPECELAMCAPDGTCRCGSVASLPTGVLIQTGGLCRQYKHCGDDEELDDATCACLPVGGLPDLPPGVPTPPNPPTQPP